MKYITLVMLTRAKACVDQKLLFKSTFGLRAELTTANMAKALESGLSFEWLAPLLPQTALDAYDAQVVLLWEAYAVQREPLVEAYAALSVPLRKSYGEQLTTLWHEYWAQIVPLMEAYDAQNTPLLEALYAQRNVLLLNALLAARSLRLTINREDNDH